MAKIAYICDGLVPECSEKVGCFRCRKPGMDYCRHTFDPGHSAFGAVEKPDEFPERFMILDESQFGVSEPTYWEGELIKEDGCE